MKTQPIKFSGELITVKNNQKLLLPAVKSEQNITTFPKGYGNTNIAFGSKRKYKTVPKYMQEPNVNIKEFK